MVSENVEIETLSCQEGAEPVHWESKDGMDFAISEGHRATHGTSIILHISDEEKEFLELYRVREVLTRYCGYMAYPIYLMDANAKPVEREEEIPGETNEDGTPKKRKVVDEPKPSLINDTKPLWLKKPSECEDKEYIDFYHKMFGWEDPLFWVHLNVDYPFNLKGILYFPKLRNDFGKYEGSGEAVRGVRCFVADNVKEVIPEFLTLLKGRYRLPRPAAERQPFLPAERRHSQEAVRAHHQEGRRQALRAVQHRARDVSEILGRHCALRQVRRDA